jgi:serine phosphatase RsbU (regulator of sigma subunit)
MWLDRVRADLAVAVEFHAARYARVRLRRGLDALRRIGAAFSGALTPAEIAHVAVAEGREVLDAATGLLYLLEEGHIRLVAQSGYEHDRLADWRRIPLATRTPTTDAVRGNRVVMLGSRTHIEDAYPLVRETPAAPDAAWVAVPLVIDGSSVGALFFAYHRPRLLTPDELRLATTIADHCAQALDRVRLQDVLDHVRRSESEQRFRAALDAMHDHVTIQTAVRDERGEIVDFRIEYVNAAPIEVAGRSSADLTGKLLLDLYPAMRHSDLFHGYVKVVETGEPLVLEELPYEDRIDGRLVSGFYAVSVARFGDGIITSSRDISEARKARGELQDAYEQLAAARQIAGLGIWSIDLSTGTLTFSDELYQIFDYDPHDPLPPLAEAITTFIDPDDISLVQRLLSQTPITGEPFLVEVRGRRADGTTATLMVAGTVSYSDHGDPVRLWGTAQDVTEQRRTEAALEEAAAELAREHASMLMLQRAITPVLPQLASVELHGVYLPAGAEARVGGDWFDAAVLADGSLALTVGDVAGHGLAAAVLMAQLRHALRAYLALGMEPHDALGALDQMIAGSHPMAYATCLTAIYEPGVRRLRGASAGHLPHAVVRDGVARYAELAPGPPLGATRSPRYPPFETTVEPGDLLLLYTDGLVEQRGESITDGLDRLLDLLGRAAASESSLAGVCEQLCDAMFADRPRDDDVCLLALRFPATPGNGG